VFADAPTLGLIETSSHHFKGFSSLGLIDIDLVVFRIGCAANLVFDGCLADFVNGDAIKKLSS
jgi:hypothetical protein